MTYCYLVRIQSGDNINETINQLFNTINFLIVEKT